MQAAAFTVGLLEGNCSFKNREAGHTLQDEILALELSALTGFPTGLGSRRLVSRFH